MAEIRDRTFAKLCSELTKLNGLKRKGSLPQTREDLSNFAAKYYAEWERSPSRLDMPIGAMLLRVGKRRLRELRKAGVAI